MMFVHSLLMVQRALSAIATLVHSLTNDLPDILNSCLKSLDSLITGIAGSVGSISDAFGENVENLIKTVLTSPLFLI